MGFFMKIAILYATVGGTTRECAHLLARELDKHDVTVANMDDCADILEYDIVVLGFPVRMGKAHKKARKYLKDNQDKLARVNAGYFMCCGFVDCFDEYREKIIPGSLGERAIDISCFGGSLEPSRFRGLDKMIVKAVRAEILGGGENGENRDDMSLPTIMDENIAQFADKLKRINENAAW